MMVYLKVMTAFLVVSGVARAQQCSSRGYIPGYVPGYTYSAPRGCQSQPVVSSNPQTSVQAQSSPVTSPPVADGEPRWYTLSNIRDVQGYGKLNVNGYVVEITEYRSMATGKALAPGDVAAHSGVFSVDLGPVAQVASGGDPYGFLAWLNGVRARHGRRPVIHDPGLSGQAAANNGQQHARGMGHHYMGSARRQNSGMGSAGSVWPMWMASPAHQDALLDPSITRVGIATSGSYWTFNAY